MEAVDEQHRIFVWWLRTGRRPQIASGDDIELKFNPYHDPRNGRFTFAPGGGMAGGSTTGPVAAHQARPPSPSRPMMGRGNNIRAFEDPMTLEQIFPGLHHSPGGAILALADNFLDVTGPATAMMAEVLQDQAKQLIAHIKTIDPTWHYDEIMPVDRFGNPTPSVQGLSAKVDDLRFQRAALLARLKGDYEPLQVETLRFVQQRADDAYEVGEAMLKAGRLTPRLSEREAVGNFIDRRVRDNLRSRYSQLGIDSAGKGPVRVNRRENDSSGNDLTYRRPDARVNDVAFDVTLTRKSLATQQVRGFFNTDFRPSRVVIIRPRQLGEDHTYVISRPETKR